MAKSIPSYLKLHDGPAKANTLAAGSAELGTLARAFAQATGWPLRIGADGCDCDIEEISDSMCSAPDDPGVGDSLGHVRVGFDFDAQKAADADRVRRAARNSASPFRCPVETARSLANAIAGLLGQLANARRTVQHRDAELAAGVPVIAKHDEPEQFTRLLESVLQAGADSCECQAAALYMLDDATSTLQLRASVGLPVERQSQPPRPLKGAIADLEALLGHAVALERASAFGPWRVPEEFAAALCVPVSSPTIPLGTLWFFSDHPRDFTDRQTNFAEVIAGRLAAELERAILLAQFSRQAPAIID